MTVIERLYDNAWYVANAAPAAREELAAAVTKAWMDRESAVDDARSARGVATLAPARSALALSLGNAAQAGYDRARARAAEAARCTDIIAGHAFSVSRTAGAGGAMTVEVASCTLSRHATLRVSGRGEPWTYRPPIRRTRAPDAPSLRPGLLACPGRSRHQRPDMSREPKLATSSDHALPLPSAYHRSLILADQGLWL